MKTKETRKQIKSYLAGIPEQQIATGIYVKSVGTKYVHIVNTWEPTSSYKITLKEFHTEYCN